MDFIGDKNVLCHKLMQQGIESEFSLQLHFPESLYLQFILLLQHSPENFKRISLFPYTYHVSI